MLFSSNGFKKSGEYLSVTLKCFLLANPAAGKKNFRFLKTLANAYEAISFERKLAAHPL